MTTRTRRACSLTSRAARARLAIVHHPIASDLRPDVAVLDIGLPDMDGDQLVARLRELYPVLGIALSGYVQEKDRSSHATPGSRLPGEAVSINAFFDVLVAG